MNEAVRNYILMVLEQERNVIIANKLHVEFQLGLPEVHRLPEFQGIDEDAVKEQLQSLNYHLKMLNDCVEELDYDLRKQ